MLPVYVYSNWRWYSSWCDAVCEARKNFSDYLTYSSHPSNGKLNLLWIIYSMANLGAKLRYLYLFFILIFIFKNIISSYLFEIHRYKSLFHFICFCSLYYLILWSHFFVCFDWVMQHKHGCHEIAFRMHEANYEKRLRYILKKCLPPNMSITTYYE